MKEDCRADHAASQGVTGGRLKRTGTWRTPTRWSTAPPPPPGSARCKRRGTTCSSHSRQKPDAVQASPHSHRAIADICTVQTLMCANSQKPYRTYERTKVQGLLFETRSGELSLKVLIRLLKMMPLAVHLLQLSQPIQRRSSSALGSYTTRQVVHAFDRMLSRCSRPDPRVAAPLTPPVSEGRAGTHASRSSAQD